MNRFTNSVRAALQEENWYAALTLALTLPDICARLDQPKAKSQSRYAHWFDTWLRRQHYEIEVPARIAQRVLSLWPEESSIRQEGGRWIRTFMSGNDCYALRCSLLHEGGADVTMHRASRIRDALDAFHFVVPPPGISVHKNQKERTLQLQVDRFCLEIADAVDAWAAGREGDPKFQAGLRDLLSIQIMSPGQGFAL